MSPYGVVGDCRFRGWGGEDHSAMRALDTLDWRHTTHPTQVLHLWHPMLSRHGSASWVEWKDRLWDGSQSWRHGWLIMQYSAALVPQFNARLR